MVSSLGRRQRRSVGRCGRADRPQPVDRPAGGGPVRAREGRAARTRRRDAQPHGQQGVVSVRLHQILPSHQLPPGSKG